MTGPSRYFPFTLRLYAHVLTCLRDHNFTGLDLFYRIKDCWKRRDTPHDLLLRPLEQGLPVKVGEWCFGTMFDVDGYSESMTRPYFKQLGKEDFLWFLDDVVEAGRASGLLAEEPLLGTIATRIDEIGSLYPSDEAAYFDQIEGAGRRQLTKMFLQLCRDKREPLLRMGQMYAYEVGDRILHDRELCYFMAETVINIGFNGETEEGMRSKWVERKRWPSRVKAILHARDRGKCAACGVDIDQELHKEGHIDHMFPLVRGGCNDLVNLQLLCSSCNQKKLDRAETTTSSVPPYILRPKKPRDTVKS